MTLPGLLLAALLWTVAPAASLVSQPPVRWTGTWSSSQQVLEPANALPADALNDVTLRQTVHVSCGGTTIRVRFSNAFGTRPLGVTAVHVARPAALGQGAIDPATDHALLFNGRADVLIPAAAEYWSDPLTLDLGALSDLTVSMHVEAEPGRQTGHPGSRETTFYAAGDLTSSPTLPAAKQVDHWYFLSGIDVASAKPGSSIVALGDSITDGHGATTNGNDRWTDVLARRLQAERSKRGVGVLNQGIGGNHLLTDGLGPNVLARLDRDVLAQPGARSLIVLEGVNDLGELERVQQAPSTAHAELVHRMLGAYQQIIARAHAQGLRVIGATIMPYFGSDFYHPGAASEQDRQTVNAWIRGRGHFDAVIDFDRVVADPRAPSHMLPAYDSGDHLHPGPAGYQAMGEAIDLRLFQ